MSWTDALNATLVRTFSATAAEAAGLPGVTTYTRINPLPGNATNRLVEFIFDTLAFGGTANATSVTFYFFGKVDRNDGTGSVLFYQDQVTFTPTDLATNPQVTLLMGCTEVYVKVQSFSGGTAPTVASGAVRARAL